jgi:hypothetical protein
MAPAHLASPQVGKSLEATGPGGYFSPQKRRITNSWTLAASNTVSRSTHSIAAWAPSPAGPYATAGIPFPQIIWVSSHPEPP